MLSKESCRIKLQPQIAGSRDKNQGLKNRQREEEHEGQYPGLEGGSRGSLCDLLGRCKHRILHLLGMVHQAERAQGRNGPRRGESHVL